MIKCIAIDDEPLALQVIETYIQKLPHITLLKTFRSALSAFEYIQKNPIDLMFLDINMPDLTGLQFLKTIPMQDRPMLIFSTAYSEYALESYEHQAVDYLLKPIEFERFLKAINRAQELYLLKQEKQSTTPINEANTIQDSILIRSDNKYHRILLKELILVEASGGNYLTFHLKDKKLMTLMNLQEAIQLLPSNFIRIHKSHIINIDFIESMDNSHVTLKNMPKTEELPIGMYYRNELKQIINQFLKKQNEK